MKHLDLFSGIGGFALAADRIFGEVEHIFCEIDPFCQQVLKKHWPKSKIYGDIRTIITDANIWESRPRNVTEPRIETYQEFGSNHTDILTGGFPCQPFSQAGRRKGTEDNRYLWPQMLRVIQLTHPQFIIAENVRGLLTWNEGMVFEQVCLDLENEGYEVQPFIIPAVAVNAPHRRDRIWFVANCTKQRLEEWNEQSISSKRRSKDGDTNTLNTGLERRSNKSKGHLGQSGRARSNQRPDWGKNWIEVATELCRMDDGLSKRLVRLPDGRKISYPKWRQEALKAYGNAIVPQIAEEIMKAIKANS